MSEQPKFPEATQTEQETLEQKKERLVPIFKSSQEVFQNPDRSLREGAMTVTRRGREAVETISGLVVLSFDDAAVELGGIEEDGEIGASAFMEWEEIIDAKRE